MSTQFPDDDPLAERLREALDAEAAMVEPSDDGLSTIRDGIEADGGRPWWQHPAAPAAAAAVVLALMAGGIAVAFHGGGGNDDVVAGGTTTSSAPSTSAPSTSAPSSGAPSTAPQTSDPAMTTATPVPVEGNIYVYYVMDDPVSGPRLFREQRPNAGSAPATAALRVMFTPATDPDYTSSWPAGTKVIHYARTGDTATIDVSAFPRVGAQAEKAAVQQVVYTVTANDPTVKRVRILVNGKTPSGHLDLSKPVARAPMADVQGWIWLLTPTQGATVASPVTISGFGTAFEGTISWEVTQHGSKVAEGATQGGSNGEFADFTDTVTLPPGSYQIRAFEASAESGQPVHVDTKSFTVK